MRNLNEYPITYDEKIDLLKKFIDFRRKVEEGKESTCGDLTLVTLLAIEEDVWRLNDLND